MSQHDRAMRGKHDLVGILREQHAIANGGREPDARAARKIEEKARRVVEGVESKR